ncbi:hypothetical protein [Allomesorhizobium camelthorni]|uniref:Uncharacterized protein n=1 Tax=Allomesorhizobium camelthorni TaxID=475069 RepID=A0A6G4WB86_9HYPH|nr:hypothetical protein [Mesorhizobium camelthorni]NGO51598.1 hypothetical protein [Mesorhizobium camelthorni]
MSLVAIQLSEDSAPEAVVAFTAVKIRPKCAMRRGSRRACSIELYCCLNRCAWIGQIPERQTIMVDITGP